MKTYGDFPNLSAALQVFCKTHGIELRSNIAEITVPGSYITKFEIAEAAVIIMTGKQLGNIVPPDMIDTDIAMPTDDALEVAVSGEESVVKLLASMTAGGEELDELLQNFYDGELRNDIEQR